MQVGNTASRAYGLLPHPLTAFDGLEVVPTVSGEAREAHLVLRVGEGRSELVRPLAPAAIDNHHDVLARLAAGGHHLMEIWTEVLGLEVGHDFREDLRGAI
jgi:hypothetical protein